MTSTLTLQQIVLWYRDIGQHIAKYHDEKSTPETKNERLIQELLRLLEYSANMRQDDVLEKSSSILNEYTWIEERQMWIYTEHYLKNKEKYDAKIIEQDTFVMSNKMVYEKMMEDVWEDKQGEKCSIM